MGLHKLTAGDGYTYLTRQVAAHDATEKGHTSLGDYYAQKGESPGRWLGSGLKALSIEIGEVVSEEQMKALFGEGRHPDAAALEAAVIAAGGGRAAALAAGALGRPFRVFSAAGTFQVEVARRFCAYNLDRGVRWDAAIPVQERARIRTGVAAGLFLTQHGRAPSDARELSGFTAKASRQATTAVAGYDLTFSPVKSVSTLWALAPADAAARIEQAHAAAVADTIGWLEREVAFTRVGRAGVRQVAVRGLVGAGFTHRDSRAGDPDLHTHVAVSNKVQTEDGRWLALDGRVLFKANVAASERYNTRLEAELTARLGVRFVERDTEHCRRPVREIDGVDPLLSRFWSRRRAAIEERRGDLAARFQASHGRPPTPVEAIALAQQATLETRGAKHAPRSEAEQRAIWRKQAVEVLGGEQPIASMVRRSLNHGPAQTPAEIPPGWIARTSRDVVAALESSRATWQVWHVRAEAERRARAAGVDLQHLDEAVGRLVEHTLTVHSVRLGTPDYPVPEPAPLRRTDGQSVYTVTGSTAYTSARILDSEHRLLAAARRRDGRAVSDVRVAIAITDAASQGTELNDAQAAMVRDLATSGARLQLALAPAGTGKTTALRALAQAWTSCGQQVIGLAPSAQAAGQLRQAVGGHTETLTKLTWTLTHTSPKGWPGWIDGIGPRTLVIIDEAGQAGTAELAAAVDFITGRGGSVRLVGDDQQLASVAAGGILRDLQHSVGAATLSEVHRFGDPAEAAATLAVRDGDPAALGFYADNGRIHVGDVDTVTDQAYQAWKHDRAAGLDSILLAPTRDLVTRLNQRARTDRLPTGAGGGPEVSLVDGSRASVGDTIITRSNDRRLTVSRSDWVKNGDRWIVQAVRGDGSITARHLRHRRSVVLPAAYVGKHVELGYAATVHAAQGLTVDTAHTVVCGDEPRQLLYVALSRGRTANHLYLTSAHDGNPHNLIRPEALITPTAIDLLTGILNRDGSQHSAHTTRRELDSPAAQLRQAALRYHDALGFAAEHTLGNQALNELDRQADAILPGLTGQPAYPTLRAHLALRTMDGADPADLLTDAAAVRELGSADDPAAVLDWRIGGTREAGPLPWLPPVPARLAESADWGGYLQARAQRLATLAEQVRATARAWTPGKAPPWAGHLTNREHAELRGDLTVWRAAYQVADGDLRPAGPPQIAVDAARHQRQLNRRVQAVSGTSNLCRDHPWRLPQPVITDPHAGRLIDRLAALHRAGIDVDSMLATAVNEPRSLPDERPADALWWRLIRHLGPAALPATGNSPTTLRPSWTATLTAALGQQVTDRIFADPAWPALMAAVHAAPGDEWTAEQIIAAALDGFPGLDGGRVPVEEVCAALVWRVAVLTDGPPDHHDDPVLDCADEESLSSDNPPTVDREKPQAGLSSPDGAARTALGVDRIIELNRQTVAYYQQQCPRSWAPAYLRRRLGTDLTDQTPFSPGYAPPGPTSLIRHLTNLGATEPELIEAGLARRTDRGHVIDAFRDRLVFAIQNRDDVVGFIARRNPSKDDSEHGGPKYLNTRTTAAFVKGKQMFGLFEAAEALDGGAVPVLVEGPLDAIAVTLAGQGRAVGVAPLGTAFTATQAEQLRPYFRDDPARVAVATDPDSAGWQSAQRAYWQLTRYGADPQHLALPNGVDPADLLREHGPVAVRDAIAAARPLAGALIDTLITHQAEALDSPATRLRLVQKTGQVIGALPPNTWIQHIDRVTSRLGLPAGMLHMEVAEAGHAWSSDPERLAHQRIAEMHQSTGAWPVVNIAARRTHADGHDALQRGTRLLPEPRPMQQDSPAQTRKFLQAPRR